MRAIIDNNIGGGGFCCAFRRSGICRGMRAFALRIIRLSFANRSTGLLPLTRNRTISRCMRVRLGKITFRWLVGISQDEPRDKDGGSKDGDKKKGQKENFTHTKTFHLRRAAGLVVRCNAV